VLIKFFALRIGYILVQESMILARETENTQNVEGGKCVEIVTAVPIESVPD
jgi:hypothetical protein